MGYTLPRWTNPGRKRDMKASYSSPNYTWYYDLDIKDFTDIVNKFINNIHLDSSENERFGKYLYTICYIVLENRKFKNKPTWEKEGLIEQAMYELLTGLKYFDSNKGKIYSYTYRVTYVAYCHWYSNNIEEHNRNEIIKNHCIQELNEYYDEYSDHKVRTTEYGR